MGSSGTVDSLLFTGLTAFSVDVVFNNNSLSLVDLGGATAGTYRLFSFDQRGSYSGTLALGTLPGFDAQLVYNSATIDLVLTSTSAVPEPSTYAALAGAAMLGLAVWRRRRARAQA